VTGSASSEDELSAGVPAIVAGADKVGGPSAELYGGAVTCVAEPRDGRGEGMLPHAAIWAGIWLPWAVKQAAKRPATAARTWPSRERSRPGASIRRHLPLRPGATTGHLRSRDFGTSVWCVTRVHLCTAAGSACTHNISLGAATCARVRRCAQSAFAGAVLAHASARAPGQLRRGVEGIDFLGCHLRKRRSRRYPRMWYLYRWPSRRAMAAIRGKIRQRIDRRYAPLPLEQVGRQPQPRAARLGRVFRHGNSSQQCAAIDSYMRLRLATLASVKPGRPRRNWTTRYNYAWSQRLGVHDGCGSGCRSAGERSRASSTRPLAVVVSGDGRREPVRWSTRSTLAAGIASRPPDRRVQSVPVAMSVASVRVRPPHPVAARAGEHHDGVATVAISSAVSARLCPACSIIWYRLGPSPPRRGRPPRLGRGHR
jgi:hypothetical protein